jgi:hypothetical protein
MTVKPYFENLTSGMRAKLDASYRNKKNHGHHLSKGNGNGIRVGFLEDAVGKIRPLLVGRRN